MYSILVKSFVYLFVIAIAYFLKNKGIFKFDDYEPLSKLTFYLTTPCLIMAGFREFVFDSSLFVALAFGALVNIIIIGVVLFFTRNKSGETQATYIMTAPTFNIGSMVLPFLLGVYPGEYLPYLFMFDIGNAIMCTGLVYAIAQSRLHKDYKFNLKDFIKSLLSSIPFTCYLILFIISLTPFKLPAFFFDVTQMIGNASVIAVMFMLGLMLKIKLEKEDLVDIIKIFSIRYGVIIILSILVLNFFPAPIMARQIIVLCMLAPLTSLTAIFCSRLNLKPSVYSFVASMSMPISIVLVMLVTSFWL